MAAFDAAMTTFSVHQWGDLGGRPEALLDPAARLSCSAWSFVGDAVHDRFARDLSRDLSDGTWDGRHGRLRTQPAVDGSLILVTARP